MHCLTCHILVLGMIVFDQVLQQFDALLCFDLVKFNQVLYIKKTHV